MIDTIQKLIDRLIQWATIKTKRRKALFAEVYKPLFAEMEKIHLDYVGTFSTCVRRVDEESFIEEIVSTIEEMRLPLRPIREKVMEYLKTLAPRSRELPPAEMEFTMSLARYLGVQIPWFSRATRMAYIMSLLKDKTVCEIELPIDDERDANAYCDLADGEPTFISYGVVKYVKDHRDTVDDKKREIAAEILSKEIVNLSERWACICTSFARLHIEIAKL